MSAETFVKVLEYAPQQIGMVIIVLVFVSAQIKSDMRKEKLMREQMRFFAEIHQEHVDQRQLSREAICESTAALKHTAEVLRSLMESINRNTTSIRNA